MLTSIQYSTIGIVQYSIIGIVAILEVILFVRGWMNPKFRQRAPGLMTTLGILGTFVGITIAIYGVDFTSSEITNSVTSLLNGMKVAFVTSVLGLLFSLVFRWSLPPEKASQNPLDVLSDIHKAIADDDVTVLSQLKHLRTDVRGDDGVIAGIRGLRNDVHDQLFDLNRAIGGDDERSLVGRLDRLRTDVREESGKLQDAIGRLEEAQQMGFSKLDALTSTIRDALVTNLETLITDLRETIGEQLAGTIQTLIDNIEKALIEQFGKTFIEFNEATQAIKKWQEDHRHQVEELTAAFNVASTAVKEIAANCATIPPTMELLRDGMTIVRRDIESLNQHIEAFAAMKKQAEQAFPLIKKNLDAIGDDLSSSAASFHDLRGVIESTFEAASADVKRIVEESRTACTNLTKEMSTSIDRAMSDSEAAVRRAVENNADKIGQLSKRTADDIRNAMNPVAEEWGRNMVAIAKECGAKIEQASKRPN